MNINELQTRLRAICEEQGVSRLDLFGSRARSQELRGRDYDFVVEFTRLPPVEYARRFFGLLHALEDELDSPVDLLTTAAVRRESLRRRIAEEKVTVYAR